jgi:formylglycine-generating enzyme required for sulfatase activity
MASSASTKTPPNLISHCWKCGALLLRPQWRAFAVCVGVLVLGTGIMLGLWIGPSHPDATRLAAAQRDLAQKYDEVKREQSRLQGEKQQLAKDRQGLEAERQQLAEERKQFETAKIREKIAEAGGSKASSTSETPSSRSGETQVAVAIPPVTPPVQPPTGKTWTNGIGIEFVLIQASTFQMGSNYRDTFNDKKPAHQMRISRPFYLGKYEVTQDQWQAIMGDNPSQFKGYPTLPVDSVSWEDVQEFIRRINARKDGAQYRLPTEAEWEYAARAGTTTDYSFGDDARQLGEYAWYQENAERKTHPVGRKQPNPWGLYDMYGNVWEWVQDWYGPYTAGAAVDLAGPSSGSDRVLRGGGWLSGARLCRSAVRDRHAPGNRGALLGVRLLRTVP